jgi:hypothetical protein
MSNVRAIYNIENTHQLHVEGLLLLLLLLLVLLLLLDPPPKLPQPLVVGRLHRTHVRVGVRAGRRRLQVHCHQLLVREQIRLRPAGD